MRDRFAGLQTTPEGPTTDTPWIHCSLGGDGSTDLVTNVTRLAPARFKSTLPRWLDLGGAPADFLSLFLHEATHHWCFITPVGSAIAALILRARQHAAMLAEGADDSVIEALLNDLVRARAAMMYLRPFAEGLACFAEFDAASKIRSRALSPIMRWTGLLFADPRRTAAMAKDGVPLNVAFDEGVLNVLARLRRDPATLDRKASLLLQPLAASAGGYLPGYLAVKSLWRTLCQNCFRAANETDLFLMYLRSYVYDDYALVRVLLEPSVSTESASAIIMHLSERVDRFVDVSEDDFDRYEGQLAEDRSDGAPLLAGILVPEEDARVGQKLLREALNDLVAPRAEPKGMRATSAWYSQQVLLARHLMSIGSVHCDVTIRDGVAAVATDGTAVIFEGEVVHGGPTTGGPGLLELVFSMGAGGVDRAVVVTCDGKLVSCRVVGVEADKTLKLIQDSYGQRRLVLETEVKWNRVLALLLKDSLLEHELHRILTLAAEPLDEFFRDLALKFAGSHRDADRGAVIDRCADLMRDRGVRAFLPEPRLVKGLALIGLLCSVNPSIDYLTREFRVLGLDLDETLAEMARVHALFGFPPEIGRVEGSVFSTV